MYKEKQPVRIYYTSGEVAKSLGCSTELLQYYALKYLKNIKRSKRKHFKYTPQQVEILTYYVTLKQCKDEKIKTKKAGVDTAE